MTIKKKISSLLVVFLLFVVSWFVLQFVKFILERPSDESTRYSPLTAETVIHIKAKELMAYSVEGLIRHHDDEGLFTLLNERFAKAPSKNDASLDKALNLLSDVVLFKLTLYGKPTWGLLAKVNDTVAFANYAKQTNSVCSWYKKRGVVFFASTPKNRALLMQKAQSIARYSIIESPKSASRTGHSFISIAAQQARLNNDYFKVKSVLDFNEHDLHLQGSLLSEKEITSFDVLQKRLAPHHFHCSSSLVPAALNDTLQVFAKRFNASVPRIRSFSFNHSGTRIYTDQIGTHIIPQLEVYIECETPVSIRELLNQSHLKEQLGYDVSDKTIEVGNTTLYYAQISPTSFYLGVNPNPRFETRKSQDVVVLDGELKYLPLFSGNKMTIAFIKLIPLVQASTVLSMRSKEIHFSLQKTAAKQLTAKGSISFVPNTHPTNELLRFVLTSGW